MGEAARSLDKKSIYPREIFAEGIKSWRAGWLKLSGIYLIIYIPVTLAYIFLPPKESLPRLAGFLVSAAQWTIDSFAVTSLILAAKELLGAAVVRVAEVLRSAVKYFWRYLLTASLYGLIVGGIALLIIIGVGVIAAILLQAPAITGTLIIIGIVIIAGVAAGVYYGVRFSLAGIISIMELVSPVAALKTSYRLIKQHATAVIGGYFLVVILATLLFIPFLLLSPALLKFPGGGAALGFYQLLASAVAVPVWVTVFITLYNKLKEAAG